MCKRVEKFYKTRLVSWLVRGNGSLRQSKQDPSGSDRSGEFVVGLIEIQSAMSKLPTFWGRMRKEVVTWNGESKEPERKFQILYDRQMEMKFSAES